MDPQYWCTYLEIPRKIKASSSSVGEYTNHFLLNDLMLQIEIVHNVIKSIITIYYILFYINKISVILKYDLNY